MHIVFIALRMVGIFELIKCGVKLAVGILGEVLDLSLYFISDFIIHGCVTLRELLAISTMYVKVLDEKEKMKTKKENIK